MESNKDWQVGLSLKERIEKLTEYGFLSDCNFSVGSGNEIETIKSHRVILATASPVFEAMFFGQFEDNVNPIEIVDIHPQIFKLMLQHIYCRKAYVDTVTEVCALYYAAHKYMLTGLMLTCCYFIKDEINTETLCRILTFAKLYGESAVMNECHKFIVDNTEDFFKSPSFLEVNVSTLETIVSAEQLNVSDELELWGHCLRWASFKCEKEKEEVNAANQRKALQTVIPIIRFLAMTSEEFAEGPAKTNILTETECENILTSLASLETSNMPSNLCVNTKSHCIGPDLCLCRITDDYCDSVRNQGRTCASLYFKSSIPILLKGIRISKCQDFMPVVTCWVVTVANSLICQERPAIFEVTSHIRNYMLSRSVDIKPLIMYRLFLEFDPKIGFNRYTIKTPVESNNAIITICKFLSAGSEPNSNCGRRGFCTFENLIFSVDDRPYIPPYLSR